MDVEGDAVFQLLNEIRESTNSTDFQVHSFSGFRLLIIGSFDLAYYHEVEICFDAVAYIELPTCFDRPALRFAKPDEAKSYTHLGLDDTERLFVFEIDQEINQRRYVVAAQSVKARKCMVYHYRRENLKEGEEIAPWVE
jgi:hypothetical protein